MTRLLLLLALVIMAPCFAQASCGDWLAHHESQRGEEVLSRQHLLGMNAAAETRQPSDEMIRERSAANSDSFPRPCSGPSCRQAPSLPPIGPAPPVNVWESDVKFIECRDIVMAFTPDGRFGRESSEATFSGSAPSPLERPPRV